MMCFFLYLVVCVFTISCYGLDADTYFYLNDKGPRCFLEDLPAETIFLGTYKHPDAKTKAVIVKVYDMEGKQVYSEPADEKGRFAYHSVAAGEHKVCIEADRSKAMWPGRVKQTRFHLKLEIHGEDKGSIADDGEIAKAKHLSSLEKELEVLENKVDLISKDLVYSKDQEKHFRDQSERINGRIMWWSLFQTVLLLLSGVWQVVHLKNFFRAKKLV